MKRIKIINLLLLSNLFIAPVLMLNSCGTKIEYETNNYLNRCFITAVQSGKTRNVVIPSEYDGKEVYGIGNDAFRGDDKLVNLTLPNTIKEIFGFRECYNLKNIYYNGTIEDWLKIKFNYNPLEYAENLYFLDENGKVRKNGNRYSLVTEIVVPESVKEIGDYAFFCYEKINKIEIPEGVTSIGTSAFYSCNKVEKLVIPNSMYEISFKAFEKCDSLKSISIPFVGGNTTANKLYNKHFGYIFGANDASSQDKKLPQQLEEVIITDSNKIYRDAFKDCLNIKDIYISKFVKIIEHEAFDRYASPNIYCETNSLPLLWEPGWCGSSATVNFGVTKTSIVTTIGELTYSINNEEAAVLNSINKEASLINVPSYIVFENKEYPVTVIAGNAFKKHTKLIDVTLPNTLKLIGNSAFESCIKLTSITIPDNVNKIGSSAFLKCKKLSAIVLPKGLENIEFSTFEDCVLLESVAIPNSVISIGNNAFKGCSVLEEIVIPEGTDTLGDEVFINCIELKKVSLPNTIRSVGNRIFKNCQKLLFNEFNSGLYIGNNDNPYLILVKAKNTDVTSCIINESTKIVLDYAYFNCKLLNQLVISKSVEVIKECAFGNCVSLRSVVIPATIKKIEFGVFLGAGTVEENVYLFCEVEKQPADWIIYSGSHYHAFWSNEWKYVDGVPTIVYGE